MFPGIRALRFDNGHVIASILNSYKTSMRPNERVRSLPRSSKTVRSFPCPSETVRSVPCPVETVRCAPPPSERVLSFSSPFESVLSDILGWNELKVDPCRLRDAASFWSWVRYRYFKPKYHFSAINERSGLVKARRSPHETVLTARRTSRAGCRRARRAEVELRWFVLCIQVLVSHRIFSVVLFL